MTTEKQNMAHICNHKVLSRQSHVLLKCHFIHHFYPDLRLGPFHLEEKMYSPSRYLLHDFLFPGEINWILEHSKPALSKARMNSAKYARTSNNRSVQKAIQTWFSDINWNYNDTYVRTSSMGGPLKFAVKRPKNAYDFTVQHSIVLKISKRFEIATKLNITARYGSTQYQSTHYGLAGMVQTHSDTWGYEKGAELIEQRKHLVQTGDVLATLMTWLAETKAGGGTAFTEEPYKDVFFPQKGSVAVWYTLSTCHRKDISSNHMGCPVLLGSKWILNKWIYSYNQWNAFPCNLIPNTRISPFQK